ncbi:hypothetical protein [Patiriisocius marinus]|nr:hypothetical protein [Patiriisocius marinus]
MKVIKTVCIVAIFSMGLFASCTPENLENDQTEQQIDRSIPIPRQG